ncbi:hypothetical protein [uncultured Duncaniella sp.]|uniref:hypothetical protein n=1 Tax=uncultured Duncaniella sp. TaxID=2768039 RepID=UPI0025B16564|nr:hypothetical protein [uncultured Duncaniella sp.]
MKKNIPEIDDLLDGINDPDIMLPPKASDEEKQEEVNDNQEEKTLDPLSEEATEETTLQSASIVNDKCWDDFLTHLAASDMRNDKDDRLVCKLDRDLADSLDDCDIGNRCRSDLVNAIIRAFFGTFLHRLVKYRREKKSLFMNYNKSKDEKTNLDRRDD